AKPGPQPRLLGAKPEQLVPHLAHANGWWRDTAQKLIILRGDKSLFHALETMARTHTDPLARLHALWTIEGLDALTPALLAEKLRDTDWRLRAAAIRLHEKTPPIALLAPLANDPDPGVRRQLALTLGWSSDPEAADLIQRIAAADPANPIITLAALTALHGREELPLVKQVQDGSLFRPIADVETRTRAQALWKSGLDSWRNVNAKPRTRDKAEIGLIENGARAYQELCLACHGSDGKGVTPPGVPVLAPTLVGSPRVLGPKEALVRILLHGLGGPIDGKDYQPSIMAPLGATMPDAWVAGVLTYIRQEWTNDASAIRAPEVAAIRNHPRATPWTLAELEQFAAPTLADRTGWIATAHGHTPMNAIDGVISASHQNAWHGVNTPQAWLAVDLGKPHRLTHLVMLSTEPDWAPRGFKVEVSDDGRTWSAAVSEGKGTGTRTVASFEPITARHVRISQTGNAIERWLVSELEIHGVPPGI
ncbi:MAG: discoidin domain-containing protein, partial [Chthoniobacteraceae bacterium]